MGKGIRASLPPSGDDRKQRCAQLSRRDRHSPLACIQFRKGAFDACLQSKPARRGHHSVALPLEKRKAEFFLQSTTAERFPM
jgi:hypothetical protein